MTTLYRRAARPKLELPEDTQILFKSVKFKPWEAQIPPLACPKRFIIVSGGEQGGKSLVGSKFLLARYPEDGLREAVLTGKNIEDDIPLLYWLVGRNYQDTEREFGYLRDDFDQLGLLDAANTTKRVDPGQIALKDGTLIKTKSANDPRNIAREAPHGIIGCEASQLDLATFERLRGRCAPKKAWLFLSGTLEYGGSIGWYPKVISSWKDGVDSESFELPTWSNLTLYPGGRNDPEIIRLERDSSEQFFTERIAGKPVPPTGLVFPEVRPDIHVRHVEFDPELDVHLWIDPGYGSAYAVLACHVIDGTIHIFDEIYERGRTTEEVIQIARHRPWINRVKFGAADIYAGQHQAMPAVAEVWVAQPPLGIGLALNSQKVKINEGTERLKSFLKPDPISGIPRLLINPNCRGLLSEFGLEPNPFDGQVRSYRWRMDREGNIIGDTPEDKNNHSVKALIYGIVQNFGYGAIGDTAKIPVKFFGGNVSSNRFLR